MTTARFVPYEIKSQDEELLMHGGLPLAGQQLVFEISREIMPSVVIEVGVASGLGSRSILLGNNCQHVHYGLDISPSFYHDPRFNTGHLASSLPGFNLLITDSYHAPEFIRHKAQLVFIDADHRHPLPTIDLWNLMTGDLLSFPLLVILDDVLLPLKFVHESFSYRGATVLYFALLRNGANEHPLSTKASLNTKALYVSRPDILIKAVLDALCFNWEVSNLGQSVFRDYDWSSHDNLRNDLN
jgi:hypothetical protein